MAEELISISRAGTEIGKFLESDLLMMIEQKKVLPTDHYWKPGMNDWELVSKYIAERQAAARHAKAAADAEAARLQKEAAEARRKREAEELERTRKAEAADAERLKEALKFNCHCCKVEFDKPFNPESEAGDGAVEILLGSLLIFIPVIGWLFMPFVILRGFAKIIASRVKTPHCPNCRSTNFSRKEGSNEPLFKG